MTRLASVRLLWLAVFLCGFSCAAQTGSVVSIAGQVGKPGVQGATVFLCDAKSGLPLNKTTHQLVTKTNFEDFSCARSDGTGRFSFTNVPPGTYRLIAQTFHDSDAAERRWGYLSAVPVADNVELHGTAENVQVPSSSATNILILPLGKGEITFDQQFPNDDGFLLLSTRPASGDPILGFLAWNRDFLSHLVGVGRMPHGRALRIGGLPDHDIQAVIFANDDSPGFGAVYYATLPEKKQRIPMIAGWSDAQHEPPPKIRHIMNVLQENNTTAGQFLKIKKPRSANYFDFLQELARALGPLDRVVVIPNGDKATVADVFACIGYKQLLEADRARHQKH